MLPMKLTSFAHKILASAAAVLAVVALAAPTRASVIVNDPNLPVLYPPNQYVTPAGPIFATYHGPGLTIVLSDSPLRDFGSVTRTPSAGNELESFSSQLDG